MPKEMKRFGEWKTLFNGRDLTGWRALSSDGKHEWQACGSVSVDPEDSKRFKIHPGEGVMINGLLGRTAHLITEMEHGDCELHVEFVVPKGSNSGVYVMGRYEVQILDSWGATDLKYNTCGGIYARWINQKAVGGAAPKMNASRPPGAWQSYDIVFRAPKFNKEGKKISNAVFEQLMWNGVVVHQNVELDGPTRAPISETEKPKGPLMLQGNHGPVAFRSLYLREIY